MADSKMAAKQTSENMESFGTMTKLETDMIGHPATMSTVETKREYMDELFGTIKSKEDSRVMTRIAEIVRKTKETDIKLQLDLDGSGRATVDTGIGFFDHMLDGFARHGFFDLYTKVTGDLIVDCHHTIEDVGIALGGAIKQALGDKRGIRRYGSCTLPMDETLILCAIDLSGRPYLAFDGTFTVDKVGYMDTEMVKEFFYAVSYSAAMNLHIKVLSAGNNHHMIEAMFKAFARALDEACSFDPRNSEILSTKGSL